MVICGQTFDFSPLNANDIERLETANEKMRVPENPSLSSSGAAGCASATICVHRRVSS